MATANTNVKKILKDASIIDSRGSNDTIKVWENHRDQATLWRAIALLQVPITLVALILGIYLNATRKTELHVPAKPLPGIYIAQDVPDTEFIDYAMTYVNHVSTFQYSTARRQFTEARKMLWDQMLVMFDDRMMKDELQKIETTSRTQLFLVDPTKTLVERRGNEVDVYLTGDRTKVIAGKEMPTEHSVYKLTMVTIPKNNFNPYGLVIVNAVLKDVDPNAH